MTEVAVFLSRNSPIGKSLRDLSERYDRLSDVWENCDRWDLMFELLDDRILEFPTHRVEDLIEGLEKYIDSSFGMVNESSDQEREQVRFRNFSYKRAAQQLRQEIDSEKLSQFEGNRRLFRHVRFVALKASQYILFDELGRFQFHKLCDDITGDETVFVDGDENELKRTIMKQQADLLRASLGNPFNDSTLAGTNN